MKKERIIRIVIGIGLFCLGWFLHTDNKVSLVQNVRENDSEYKFINPLLFLKVPEDQAFPEYSLLKKEVSNYVDKIVSEDKAADVSVYFRNLNSSQWIYVNPNETFNPASMFKVLTMISVMRVAESDPEFLSMPVTLNGDDSLFINSQTYYPVKNPVRVGNTYSVKELLNHLITESDNVANASLIQAIGEEKVLKTYDDLQLPRPEKNGRGYTAQEYSYLFRTLFNSTYLSRSVSEQVLELLSKTSFDKGLVSPLSTDTVVSHKFGVNVSNEDGVTYRELHDCGIVYYPNKPYFLCVMTKGKEFPLLESVIQDISKITWRYVDELKK